MITARDVGRLVERDAFFDDPGARAAYAALMREVFDLDIERRDAMFGAEPSCEPFALFDGGTCVASAEIFRLPLVLDEDRRDVAALRSVAVAPAWRGLGLFRRVMDRALAWCDAACMPTTLLYTEDPALYGRFGFHPTPQYKFVGPPPTPIEARPARRLSLPDDLALVRRLLASRSPVSGHVAISGGGAQFLDHVTHAEDLTLDYLADWDALVVSEQADDTFILVDLVAETMPTLATLLAALHRHPATVTVLFPPDLLTWAGNPVAEDAGLMTRGVIPPAFASPFMFPPMAEF